MLLPLVSKATQQAYNLWAANFVQPISQAHKNNNRYQQLFSKIIYVCKNIHETFVLVDSYPPKPFYRLWLRVVKSSITSSVCWLYQSLEMIRTYTVLYHVYNTYVTTLIHMRAIMILGVQFAAQSRLHEHSRCSNLHFDLLAISP